MGVTGVSGLSAQTYGLGSEADLESAIAKPDLQLVQELVLVPGGRSLVGTGAGT